MYTYPYTCSFEFQVQKNYVSLTSFSRYVNLPFLSTTVIDLLGTVADSERLLLAYPEVWDTRDLILPPKLAFFAQDYWTRCGHLTNLEQAESLSFPSLAHLFYYLELFIK